MPLKMREIAVAMPEETHHRHHPVDGVVELRRRRDVARGKGVAQRQQIEQQLDQRAGVAADVAAVRQDLALQLVDQLLDRSRACGAPGPAMHSAA